VDDKQKVRSESKASHGRQEFLVQRRESISGPSISKQASVVGASPGLLQVAAFSTSSLLAHKRKPSSFQQVTATDLGGAPDQDHASTRSGCRNPSQPDQCHYARQPEENPFGSSACCCRCCSIGWLHLDRPLPLDRVQGTARVKVKMHSDDYCNAAFCSTKSRLAAVVQPSDNPQMQMQWVRLARNISKERPALTENILTTQGCHCQGYVGF
jgi:hypothetical protein